MVKNHVAKSQGVKARTSREFCPGEIPVAVGSLRGFVSLVLFSSQEPQ